MLHALIVLVVGWCDVDCGNGHALVDALVGVHCEIVYHVLWDLVFVHWSKFRRCILLIYLIFHKILTGDLLIMWSSSLTALAKLILMASFEKWNGLKRLRVLLHKINLFGLIRCLRPRPANQFRMLEWRLRSSSIFHPYWTLRVQSLLLHLLPEISLQRGNRCITMLDEIEVYIHIDWNRDLVPKTLI